MEESSRERDDEYVPPAIILDPELDYDEFDPEEVNFKLSECILKLMALKPNINVCL